MEYTPADNKIIRAENETAIVPGYLDIYLPKSTPATNRTNWPVKWLPTDHGWQRKLIERLIDPLYGREILDEQLDELAVTAPGISQVWKITESWPSLTKLLLDDRNNE